jgi:hypothetical protein
MVIGRLPLTISLARIRRNHGQDDNSPGYYRLTKTQSPKLAKVGDSTFQPSSLNKESRNPAGKSSILNRFEHLTLRQFPVRRD